MRLGTCARNLAHCGSRSVSDNQQHPGGLARFYRDMRGAGFGPSLRIYGRELSHRDDPKPPQVVCGACQQTPGLCCRWSHSPGALEVTRTLRVRLRVSLLLLRRLCFSGFCGVALGGVQLEIATKALDQLGLRVRVRKNQYFGTRVPRSLGTGGRIPANIRRIRGGEAGNEGRAQQRLSSHAT